MELTAPVDVIVEVVPNSVEPMMPNRCSLPSIVPALSSAQVMSDTEAVNSTPMVAATA